MTAMRISSERLDRALVQALSRDRRLFLSRGQVERIAQLEQEAQNAASQR